MKKVSKKKKRKADAIEDESKNTPTFEELFAATGGARLGMRARANQNGKIQRTEALEDLSPQERNDFPGEQPDKPEETEPKKKKQNKEKKSKRPESPETSAEPAESEESEEKKRKKEKKTKKTKKSL